jgi:hypothetical protein
MKKLLCIASLSAVMFAAAPAQAEPLKNAELKKLFPGSYVVKIFGRWDLRVRMAPGGRIVGNTSEGSDTGRWSIEDGQLCIAWSKWTNGRKGCSALTRNGRRISGRGFYFNV